MSVRRTTTTALLAGACFVAVGTAAPALALCDTYSGVCPSTPPSGVGDGGTDIDGGTDSPATGGEKPGTGTGTGTGTDGGTSGVTSRSSSTPSTLPFTGGELVLLTAAGLGALAGGTALVVAGRRKAVSPA